MARTVKAGLSRKSVQSCSHWSRNYRIMGQPYPGNWSSKYHPWTKGMCDSDAQIQVGQKSAQAGYTEVALNRIFYNMDINHHSVLYVLPTEGDASDFSASRFNPALELSPHLRSMFSDASNVGHKRAGSKNLFVRGSNSRSKLKSLPVNGLVFDELEEMNQDNIPLAEERTSGQVDWWRFYLSTPSIAGYGINILYEDSDQEHFFFQCPSCSRYIELGHDNLVCTAEHVRDPRITDSHYICTECKNVLPHQDKHLYIGKTGIWRPTVANRVVVGWHVNQYYSPTITPQMMATAYLKSLVDPAAEQEYYNSKLGLPHSVKGSRVTDYDLEQCYKSFTMKDKADNQRLTTMGVDVGTELHITIYEWELGAYGDININSKPRPIAYLKRRHFEELDQLMVDFQINFCVIDANPEKRKAQEFADRFYGFVRICYYGNSVSGRTINKSSSEMACTVDRTSWLDLTLNRIIRHQMHLPGDMPEEAKKHIKALTRIYRKDNDGNPVGKWINSEPDHFAHSSNYAEIALQFAHEAFENEDIS